MTGSAYVHDAHHRGMNHVDPASTAETSFAQFYGDTLASSEFVRAAAAQAQALGAGDYKTVVVAHPIQPLTREEVRALADKAFDDIVARLTRR